jgi:excinuclease ABC subunit C
VQDRKNPGAVYFGPYHSLNNVERAIDTIRESVWLRLGKTEDEIIGWNPLKGQYGPAITPMEEETEEQYGAYIKKVAGLLRGEDNSFADYLKYKMLEASSNFRFEEAAKYRDGLKAINYIINSSRIVQEAKQRKVLAVFEPVNDDTGKVFLFSGSNLVYSELINLSESFMEPYIRFLENKITTLLKESAEISETDLTKADLDEAHIIYTYLKTKKGTIRYCEVDDSYLDEIREESKLTQEIKHIFIC